MNNRNQNKPPRIAAWVLGWLVSDHFSTPLGDFQEYYNELLEEQGKRKADWWYRGQVLRLIPDQLFEKTFWGLVMLSSYFVVGFRHQLKNKAASVINIVGLSAAVGSAIALFLFIVALNTSDEFHKNTESLYLVGHNTQHGGPQGRNLRRSGTAPAPLGPALEATYPQLDRVVRFTTDGVMVRASGNAFRERVSFADPGFFDILTFPLANGSEAALDDPSAVIIASKIADKYFRDADPIGQELELTFENGRSESFLVGGVAAEFPETASLRFEVLLGYQKRLSLGLSRVGDWSDFTDATFLQFKDLADVEFMAEELERYLPQLNNADGSLNAVGYFLDSVGHPEWRTAWQISSRAMHAPRPLESAMFGVLAILMLLVACFNYITISLGSAARRLKEIGIRKTTGADKSQLVVQFLTENLLICLFALVGGLLFAWSATIPFINSMVNDSFDIRPGYFAEPYFWEFLIGLLAVVGLLSGTYPAFYISRFHPVEILRGSRTLAEKKWLTRSLTTIQFVLTIITISFSTFAATLDEQFDEIAWGYDPGSTVVLPAFNEEQFTRFKSAAEQLPNVTLVSGSRHHIGASASRVALHAAGRDRSGYFFGVGPSYLDAMGISATKGRVFGDAYDSDDSSFIVINEAFAREMAWDDPVGQPVRVDDRTFTVLGVVNDFLIAPLTSKNELITLAVAPPASFTTMAIRVAGGQTGQVVASLRAIWERDFPEVEFSYYPQSEVFADESLDGLATFLAYVALFALAISCMGLFGLASQKAVLRVKEVGVRKAMGASAGHVIFAVNREFLVMLGIAALIATPLCYFGTSTLFQMAQLELPVLLAPFILSNIPVFAIAALSLSLQSYRLVKVVPAEVLRYD